MRLGRRLIGHPQEKAAWPSGPSVPATPSPEVAGKSARLSAEPDFGFTRPLRPRAMRSAKCPDSWRAWREGLVSHCLGPAGGALAYCAPAKGGAYGVSTKNKVFTCQLKLISVPNRYAFIPILTDSAMTLRQE